MSTRLHFHLWCEQRAGTVNPDTQHPEFRQKANHHEGKVNRERLKTNALIVLRGGGCKALWGLKGQWPLFSLHLPFTHSFRRPFFWRFSTAWYGTVRFTFGGFSTGYCTWYFFSTTSAEVPIDPYRYQNVTCKLYWSLIGRRESSLLRHWTCDTRPSSTALPARFKSAQPATDRTQLLFKQTHIFASTTK